MIICVRVVLKRNVGDGDWRFDNRNGNQDISQSEECIVS